MKINILTLILLCSTNLIKSQTLAELDKKFGINKFKLESSFDLYKSDLELTLEDDDKVKYYYYKTDDIKNLYDVEINDIYVGFYKNEMCSIQFTFKPTNKANEEQILNKFKRIFGNPKMGAIKNVKKKMSWKYEWKTNKTELVYYKLSPESIVNPNYLNVRMDSAKLRLQIDKDNF